MAWPAAGCAQNCANESVENSVKPKGGKKPKAGKTMPASPTISGKQNTKKAPRTANDKGDLSKRESPPSVPK